jgi:general secretion pathway protein F/type IV pilus assembly protein PilC
MPTFEYIARDTGGAQRSGVMQAESVSAVVRTLGQQALFPVRIEPQRAAGRGGRGRRVSLRQLGVTYSQLSDLLGAGVPALQALDIVQKASPNRRLADLIAEVRDDVSAGDTLADAMAKHPDTFVPLHVAMVRAGEHAGFLEDVLANLAGFLERQDALRSQVRGALIYPAILATVGTAVVLGLLIFLVPKFETFLGDQPLQLPSRILFGLSSALREHAPLLGLGAAAAVAAVVGFVRSPGGRKLWARWQLKIPVAGLAVRMVAITRFCRVLGTMLANGIPILDALQIAKDAAGNDLMAEAIAEAAENVKAGEPLAEPLARSGLFPVEIVEMISVGEESNQLEKVLVKIADTVERRTARQVDTAVKLIEPLMLILMAAAVLMIVIGLFSPILTMIRSLN